MSQTIYVDREVKFQNSAASKPNVSGNFEPEKKCVFYDFTELALDTTNKYTTYLDTTSTVALASGGVTLTTAATNAKVCSISAGGIWWYPAKNPVVELRFQVDITSTLGINAGFVDAASYGSTVLPISISGTTVSDTTIANGALFAYDTGATSDYWYICNDKAGTQAGTILASTYAPVAATDVTLRVAVDTLGNARYYYNGRQVGYKALATTSTTPLIGYFCIKNNDAIAHVATLKYIRYWSDM